MSDGLVEFFVFGTPAPQGSKTAMMAGNRPVVIDGSSTTGRAKHKAWRHDVASSAMVERAKRGSRFEGPIEVVIEFHFAQVKSDKYRTAHVTKPDIDKVLRATLDGLTEGGIIADDSLIYMVSVVKTHTDGPTGALISLIDRTDDEREHREWAKEQAKIKRSVARNSDA